MCLYRPHWQFDTLSYNYIMNSWYTAVYLILVRSNYVLWSMECHLCLISVLSLTCAAQTGVFYVKPDSGNHCVHQDCQDLNYYVTKSLESNSKLFFLPGRYILQSDFIISRLNRISLIGTSAATNSTPNTIIQFNSSVSIVMVWPTGIWWSRIVDQLTPSL